MKAKLLFTILLGILANSLLAQTRQQYFDGKDTLYDPELPYGSIKVEIDPDKSNIWQIGKPGKTIFDAPATAPYALVTDTINFYPPNSSSSFQFTITPEYTFGIFAIQWKQKLDMDPGLDGGKVEFSFDEGATWQNALNNPHVYNFYGFQSENQDTLPNGDIVFSGTDKNWRDIWLCYDMSWLSVKGDIKIRFTFTSDAINNNKEGWMIDNLICHPTIIHTVSGPKSKEYLHVYPNPASDIIHVEAQKLQDFHIIEQMELTSTAGVVIDEWKNIPSKFFINAKKYNNGQYLLKIKTNLKSEIVPVMINHN